MLRPLRCLLQLEAIRALQAEERAAEAEAAFALQAQRDRLQLAAAEAAVAERRERVAALDARRMEVNFLSQAMTMAAQTKVCCRCCFAAAALLRHCAVMQCVSSLAVPLHCDTAALFGLRWGT